MDNRTPTVVVAGDICVDWLHWRTPPSDEGLNWELYDGSRWAALRGGALLLADMLRRAGDVTVRAPELDDPASVPIGQALHSLAELAEYGAAGPRDRTQVYRIARFCGYTGPTEGPPQLLPIVDDDPAADVIVLDDAGNSFRSEPDYWPAALGCDGARPWAVFNMARPLMAGRLWERLQQHDPKRLVIVVSADHLRAQGVNISRRLSWERTAKDFVWQMSFNPWLKPLRQAHHLIVRLGLEGAIHYTAGPQGGLSHLFFDPDQIEGGYGDGYLGVMQGYSNAFTAALARTLARPPQTDRAGEPVDPVRAGVFAGLRTARRLHVLGYGQEAEIAGFPSSAILNPGCGEQEEYLTDVQIPPPEAREPPDPKYWSILKDVAPVALEDRAEDLVRQGTTEALRGVPVGQFGELRTADRAEIEAFRCIRNLIDEYLHGQVTRPLSVAVFGSPGSGKSFSVTEVAESVASQYQIASMEFNLSQFGSPIDLVRAFHLVRDKVLGGSMPLVFFDEFDTPCKVPLGWLKYFLAPMQDGCFRDGEVIHPIGRAIFVFAGGTHSNYQHFARMHLKSDPTLGDEARRLLEHEFVDVKGPDFVSRLRGYVNILGPDPADRTDATYVVRRAMLLRSLIERKAPQLLDSKGRARIDRGVLRAFLGVPAYKHGARSMEAILGMSMLAGRKRWEQAALPPAEQLNLHVDAESFTRLMLREVLLTGARDILGRAVHEYYLRMQEGKKPPDDPAMRPWEELDEGLQESNRQQADHILAKLKGIGRGLTPVVGDTPASCEFTADEVETMAKMEHERWMDERFAAGWVYGTERDVPGKVSPHLVPYDELAEEIKDWDREAVKAIPAIVHRAQFQVYRLGGEG